ncbi:MAG: hypothetical protein K8T91_06510 [Planctomycetes bacterium]|nr:hypothetical protein [Planctomycetota bacterium]
MNRLSLEPKRQLKCDLERVIEPLVSYICATERPKTALTRALALLVNEVEQTNQAANARAAVFSGGCGT